jgi:hypothetical protein
VHDELEELESVHPALAGSGRRASEPPSYGSTQSDDARWTNRAQSNFSHTPRIGRAAAPPPSPPPRWPMDAAVGDDRRRPAAAWPRDAGDAGASTRAAHGGRGDVSLKPATRSVAEIMDLLQRPPALSRAVHAPPLEGLAHEWLQSAGHDAPCSDAQPGHSRDSMGSDAVQHERRRRPRKMWFSDDDDNDNDDDVDNEYGGGGSGGRYEPAARRQRVA